MRHVISAVLALLLTGCPGAGGSDHHPPDRIVAGQPTVLTQTFSVWGAGPRQDLARRYTEMLCHYRHAGEQHFQSIQARIVSSDRKHMTVEYVIPPQQRLSGSDTLEYYFDCLFDGHYNKRPIERVRIIEPTA